MFQWPSSLAGFRITSHHIWELNFQVDFDFLFAIINRLNLSTVQQAWVITKENNSSKTFPQVFFSPFDAITNRKFRYNTFGSRRLFNRSRKFTLFVCILSFFSNKYFPPVMSERDRNSKLFEVVKTEEMQTISIYSFFLRDWNFISQNSRLYLLRIARWFMREIIKRLIRSNLLNLVVSEMWWVVGWGESGVSKSSKWDDDEERSTALLIIRRLFLLIVFRRRCCRSS